MASAPVSAPSPASPANDILLCPITMNDAAPLPDFATPKVEEEEEWWTDFLAPPSDDQLDCAGRETPSVSESHVTTFSPERSLHGFNEGDPQNRIICDLTPPSSPRPLSPLHGSNHTGSAMRRCFSQPDIAVKQEPSIEQIDIKEEDVDEDEQYIESTDSDDYDDYELIRRRSHHEKRRAAQKYPAKPPRIHKPKQNSRVPSSKSNYKFVNSTPRKEGIRRRQLITISSEELQRLCAERARLQAEGQVAGALKIPSPVLREDGLWWCTHARDDGSACHHPSTRAGEARRHTLTHFANVRFLCSNPRCPLAFSRQDAVKRHIDTSSYRCKESLPPGITKDSPKDAIVNDGQTWRLATLVWDT